MKVSIVHIYVYGILKRKVNGNIISSKEIKPIIRWWIRIPKKYHNDFLKEMESCNLIKRLGRDNYEILSCSFKAPCDSLGFPLW
jgi:hypothetical protein